MIDRIGGGAAALAFALLLAACGTEPGEGARRFTIRNVNDTIPVRIQIKVDDPDADTDSAGAIYSWRIPPGVKLEPHSLGKYDRFDIHIDWEETIPSPFFPGQTSVRTHGAIRPVGPLEPGSLNRLEIKRDTLWVNGKPMY